MQTSKTKSVNWLLCLLMSIFFGWLAIDRFILGHFWLGILKIITCSFLGIWWLVDIILIASRYQFKNIEWIDP